MKVIAINGSPRKEWNTGTMLKHALEGAASRGADTQMIHLYDLQYQGCLSCFSCKAKSGKKYGRCGAKDGLTPILKEIESADALILGSPVYLGGISGAMQSFLERLIFPYLTYTDPPGTLFPQRIPVGLIYTLGASQEMFAELGYKQRFAVTELLVKRIFGHTEKIFSIDTYQFEDYSKVVAPRFDPAQKLKRRQEIFPQDCRKAFEMGSRFAGKEVSSS